ncbi:ABC transporter substrate-binding protein [Sporomusa termitida]|uniref:Putative aliphatic sulfonates-binding protein n=1 Tax=Sporomusa termitida TaxID=2377 RepID=A0A517DPC1_9FIRM|nr:aliphatic sulfonate ABC transporter substrate-binding protein [Sporomusa termitida]QDR79210.1 Putative aliphatic sulfonates-binding protein [Sporomusa termitida]
MGKKNIVVAMLMVFVIGIFAAGCGGNDTKTAEVAKNTEKPKEIHVAYQNSSIIILLAKAKGFYEEEFAKDGVDVKYDLYLSGPPMIEAFAGGRADFAHTGDMPPVSARAAGVDIKVISRAGYTPGGNALLTRPDSPVKSVTDLKGKKIAVQVGSSAHHFLILLLQKNGLSANDVNIVNLPASDHQAALETQNVDAIATWEPWSSVLENAKAGKILEDSSSGVKRYIGVFLARNDFAKQYPDYTVRILKANEKAAAFMKSNPDEALELIAKESKLPVSAIARIVKTSDWDSKIIPEDIAALQQVKDFLKETKVLKKDFDINELFDDRYYQKLKQ